MVNNSSFGTASWGLWLLCNKTCQQLPVSGGDEGKVNLNFHCGDEPQDLGARYQG